jgi:restriction system protein
LPVVEDPVLVSILQQRFLKLSNEISFMTIPDFQSLMLPVLRLFKDGKEHQMKEITAILSDELGLSEEERAEMIPSGQARTIVNRAAWAKTYLDRAGLLKTVRRGIVTITNEGLAVLKQAPARIDLNFLKRYPEYVKFREKINPANDGDDKDEALAITKTPHEQLDEAYSELRKNLCDEVLQQVVSVSDKFFEKLVVDLLVSMGYGGSIADAGKAVGRSGDGGIDGVIKEDRLGLDVVVIQAKRWTNKQVGRPDVQSFAGSMEAYRAHKGVFITTSTFSEPAREYVSQIQRKIVLIDGDTLANLMIDYDIGVTTYKTFSLKRIDADSFEE